MRIKGAKIKDYKRFTDLTIEGHPDHSTTYHACGPQR